MGFVKDVFKAANELVTLGGMSRLEAAKTKYQGVYEEYSALIAEAEACKIKIEDQIKFIGDRIIAAKFVLDKAERVLKVRLRSEAEVGRHSPNDLIARVEKFDSEFSSAIAIGAGGLAGGSLAVGSWALVALIGSASTGTAISTLSGVAATNATLAWFGGGALAAGGAGMSGGMAVLGGVVALPLVYFAATGTHKKAKKFEEEAAKLEEQMPIARAHIKFQRESLVRALRSREDIQSVCNHFISVALPLIKIIRPYGAFSVAKQKLYALISLAPLNIAQVNAFAMLEKVADEFLTALKNGASNPV